MENKITDTINRYSNESLRVGRGFGFNTARRTGGVAVELKTMCPAQSVSMLCSLICELDQTSKFRIGLLLKSDGTAAHPKNCSE